MNILTSKQAIGVMEANGYIIQDVLPPNIAISPELRDRITECLQINKDNPLAELAQCQDLLHHPSYKRKADMLEKEIAEIDSILKELAVK